MTMRSADRPHGRWMPLLILSAALLASLLWLDARSLERANRLYRAGQALDAGEIYRASANEETPNRALYNLGTSILTTDPAEAERILRLAAQSSDSATAQRGSYNLGLSLLTSVDASTAPEQAIELLVASGAANRTALRLDPKDDDARWNLALGQHMLDSLTLIRASSDREATPGQDETRVEDVALTRSGAGDGVSGLEPEDPQPADNIGERRGAAQGAREAWATLDPGPMHAEAALSMLSSLSDEPEQLVRGILWSLRPNVAWWSAEGYPGGDW